MFIHLSTDAHLGHFQLLAIINNAAVNILASFCMVLFSILLGVDLGVESLGHMVHYEHIEKMSNCFPEWLCYFKITPSWYQGFWFLHILVYTCYFPFSKSV